MFEITKKSKVLIGCEESQVVCIEFRKKGFEAYSCDKQPCSGGHPEWHFQMDVFEVIKGGYLKTQAGNIVYIDKFDFGVFHPVCTFLTVSNNNALSNGCKHYTAEEGKILQQEAIDFFMRFVDCGIPKYAIENPIGIMSTLYRKPNQIVQPWMYGHGEIKATCLWLRGIPRLNGFNVVDGREPKVWKTTGKREERSKLRSKTYTGIAEAMANQWSKYLN